MIVAEVRQRLKSLELFKLVDGAAALSAVGPQPNATPAAFVFIEEEAAEENSRVNAVMQRVEVDLKVVVMTTNVSDAAGGAAAADVETLKAAVRDCLIGWTPASAEDVLTYVGATLVGVRSGLVTVEMTFAAAFYVSST